MEEKLWRVGTTYIPVNNVEKSTEWYVKKLGAELSFQNKDKAIVNIADRKYFSRKGC